MYVIDFLTTVYKNHPVGSILFLAILANFFLKFVKVFSVWLLTPKSAQGHLAIKDSLIKESPRFASIMTILMSSLTFAIYFVALGLILKSYKVDMTPYIASASVIGLAIGFGTQGFVQDIVIGLTLIFSNAMNVKDIVQLSGLTGRVELIGLRFTVLINHLGQRIYIPNRTIGSINRYAEGGTTIFVDIQPPSNCDVKAFCEHVAALTDAAYQQYQSIMVAPPENLGMQETPVAQWRFLRLKFMIWPEQNAVIDTFFKQRLLTLIKTYQPDYPEYQLSILART
jgi:small conductance mechanosensitive channel